MSLRKWKKLTLALLIVVQPNLFAQSRVRIGAEIFLEKHLDLVQDKRVGILCNHTSILPNRTHLVDTLVSSGVNITALFGPEHGIRGNVPAGAKVEDTVDEKSGIPIYSLYGKKRKPTKAMLENVDVLLFDVQDVGARFYTHYITMSYAMEAAAENNKVFIVLDRANPINGIDSEGPILDSSLQSGVGRFPLPIRHGLTLGELAKMIVGEKWLGEFSSLTLVIVPMEGWKREMWFDETRLPWVPPSPNMKYLSTAVVYPGMCLFEATNLSEGRGTQKPFEYIGTPWIDGKDLAKRLNSLRLPGVSFHAVKFTPQSDPSAAANPKYERERCKGVFVNVKNRKIFQPVNTALKMISLIRSLYPTKFEFDPSFFDRLAGTSNIRMTLENNLSVNFPTVSWSDRIENFQKLQVKYLLY